VGVGQAKSLGPSHSLVLVEESCFVVSLASKLRKRALLVEQNFIFPQWVSEKNSEQIFQKKSFLQTNKCMILMQRSETWH
jgi:hypothetical protein